ncbi:MAG: Transcriptional regulator, LysR family [uncultured Paraburkholderia sp.]|uniref:LysR family transcriptional regulator n=1 Tax=uncultured Paraburkholderia sp. TaxID=1822466 RepID=UPI00259857AC|nr:LysR family transcriptional regulator [uncultured Paraburkholderia sp.]CAH2901488.1 MAG: Transcriptional regulator, LysR family [uncultured Paraburkholderia sp.]CAH2934447.1 MAG: Transcriptional regulator, LysR family [uncultured Paraburkholderia sp.]
MLDLGQVRCFVAAATELNFRRAAALLNMTQPPLSRQIQLLEDNLGVMLFERIGRTVKLTTEGRVFLADATRLLNLAEQAESTVRRASKGKTGRVRLGFTGAAGYELIPELLVAAADVLPEIDVVLLELVSAAQIEAFAANTIDLGFLRPLPSRQKLEFLLVDKEPLIVALPKRHMLCQFEQIALKQLDEQPFIMHSPTQGKYFHDRIMGMLATEGVNLNIAQYIDQTPTILSLVRAGLGVAILPASAQRFHYDNVEFRFIAQHSIQAEMSMAWRADQDNPAVIAFRLMAAEYFARKARG